MPEGQNGEEKDLSWGSAKGATFSSEQRIFPAFTLSLTLSDGWVCVEFDPQPLPQCFSHFL